MYLYPEPFGTELMAEVLVEGSKGYKKNLGSLLLGSSIKIGRLIFKTSFLWNLLAVIERDLLVVLPESNLSA